MIDLDLDLSRKLVNAESEERLSLLVTRFKRDPPPFRGGGEVTVFLATMLLTHDGINGSMGEGRGGKRVQNVEQNVERLARWVRQVGKERGSIGNS